MRGSVSYKVDFSGVVLDDSWFIGNPNDYHREPWLTLGVIALLPSSWAEQTAWSKSPKLSAQIGANDGSLPNCSPRTNGSGRGKRTTMVESAAEKARAFAPIFGGDAAATKQNVPELTVYANMVRTAIEQTAMEVMKNAERCLGTRGLLAPEPAERIIRDLRLYLRQPNFDAALAAVGSYTLGGDGEKS